MYDFHTFNIQGVYMGVSKPREKDVEALIEKGAKVKEDCKSKEWFIVNLRISKSMLEDVDEAVEDRVGITRTGWILEAIHERLKAR
jgi:hypothetical protein